MQPGPLLKTIKHGVTRYRITLDCYQAAYVGGRVRQSADVRTGSLDFQCGELADLPLSTTGRKIANWRRRVAEYATPTR